MGLEAEKTRQEDVKGSLLGRISHGLRTPLTPVLLGLSDLRQRAGLPNGVREELATLQHYVEMVATLIDDMLNETESSQRKPIIHPHRMDVHDAISAAISSYHGDLERRQTLVDIDFSASSTAITGDSFMLEQVFWNLLCNACNLTPIGGRMTVHTQNAVDADGNSAVMIEIVDGGAGIEPKLLPQLFTPFTGDEPRGLPDGFGIGLAYARSIIEAHGGTFAIGSAGCGKGTSVRILLPLAQGKEAIGEVSAGRKIPTGLRVLLVEDHEVTARILARLLEGDGNTVVLAATVAQARAAIAKEDFDLLVSDLGLPDGHGTELPAIIRQKRNIPCIAVTGYSQERDFKQTREANFIAHLVKPVTIDDLRGAISMAMAKVP